MTRSARWLPGVIAACVSTLAAAQAPAQWWPGFIDTRGKLFLELPGDTRLCAQARDAVRKARADAGHVVTLPVRIETLLPAGARLTFGVVDANNQTSERVLTRVVTIARGAEKGACAYLAEAGADTAGTAVEEDRFAIGVHPPRTLSVRAPAQNWKSYGAASQAGGSPDARFAPAADAPPEWRARITPLLASPDDVFGQPFNAVLAPGQAATPLLLVGGIANGVGGSAPGTATYNTVNMVVRASAANPSRESALYQAGPSGGMETNRAGSFVAQVMLVADVDGDGNEEVFLNARYYAGGNLKVLKWRQERFVEIRQTAYEGE